MKKRSLGVMLDCSRAAVPKVETVKQLIIFLKNFGYNCLQLYTEDTYELDGEPYFGRLRGGYKKEEIREIDAFAMTHGIELIPCIQTLSHLEKPLEWAAYSDVRDCEGVLLEGEEKTYLLIEKMFKFCAENFTSRRINIGMDEAFSLGLGKHLKKHGYEQPSEIFLRHLNRVSSIADKYGFTPAMWSDMFYMMSAGRYPAPDAVIPDEIKKAVPENTELICWDYYTKTQEEYEKMFNTHISFNRNVWFVGGAIRWAGFQSMNRCSIDRNEKALAACRKCGIDNVLITLWADGGAECSPFAALPALAHAAECFYGNFDIDSIKNKFHKITGESFDDFMLFDLSDMPFPRKDDSGVGAKEMLYSDYFCGRFNEFVSVTGKERDAYAEYAEKFKIASKRSVNFSYLFDFYYRLADLLAVKYDLGKLSRKYYQEANTAELKDLIARYGKTSKRLYKFIESFRNVWFKENKPYGFEIHEIRLGGVAQRTESCKNRLADYLKGRLNVIDELEEIIPDEQPIMPGCNSYWFIATVSRLYNKQ